MIYEGLSGNTLKTLNGSLIHDYLQLKEKTENAREPLYQKHYGKLRDDSMLLLSKSKDVMDTLRDKAPCFAQSVKSQVQQLNMAKQLDRER